MEASIRRSLQILLIFSSISLQFFSGSPLRSYFSLSTESKFHLLCRDYFDCLFCFSNHVSSMNVMIFAVAVCIRAYSRSNFGIRVVFCLLGLILFVCLFWRYNDKLCFQFR